MIENQIFERIDYTVKTLVKDEYECCKFVNCNFHQADISHNIFRECSFDSCDFSLAKIKNTTLNDIKFIGCKLLGVDFGECSPFLLSLNFDNCLLKLSVFNKLRLKKTHFINCDLREAEFTETDLSESVFDNCNFSNAIFHKTTLEKADFRSSFNYSIDPENNRIKKAKFSKISVVGLLDKYNIIIE